MSVAKTHHSLRPDLENDNLPKPPRQSSQYALHASSPESTAPGMPNTDIVGTPQSPDADLDEAVDATTVVGEDPDHDNSVELPPVAPPDTDSEGLMDVDSAVLAVDSSDGQSERGLAVGDDDSDSDENWQPSSDLEGSSTQNLTEVEAAELEAFREWKRVQTIEQRKTIAQHERALKAEKAKVCH